MIKPRKINFLNTNCYLKKKCTPEIIEVLKKSNVTIPLKQEVKKVEPQVFSILCQKEVYPPNPLHLCINKA